MPSERGDRTFCQSTRETAARKRELRGGRSRARHVAVVAREHGEPGSGGAAAWRRLLGPDAGEWGREEAGRDLKGSNGLLVPVSAMNRD